VETTFETVKAAELLRVLCPALRVRVVNVTDLMILVPETKHPHALSAERFTELFTQDKPVLFNYHGYPTELQGLLFGRERLDRMNVAGYIEEGSTTTPFDMMLVNRVSRFDLAEKALRFGAEGNDKVREGLEKYLAGVKERVEKVREFIRDFGKGKFTSLSVHASCFTSRLALKNR
jgi:xylulose-5-phosphate/fructose-6-phosphate phosphoketolase